MSANQNGSKTERFPVELAVAVSEKSVRILRRNFVAAPSLPLLGTRKVLLLAQADAQRVGVTGSLRCTM
jgi:hypothetical protein